MVRRHEITIRKQGKQTAELAPEFDRAVLGLEHTGVENAELRAPLAEHGQAVKAYGNPHTQPSSTTMTQEINAQERKRTAPPQARSTQGVQGGVSEPEGGWCRASHAG